MKRNDILICTKHTYSSTPYSIGEKIIILGISTNGQLYKVRKIDSIFDSIFTSSQMNLCFTLVIDKRKRIVNNL